MILINKSNGRIIETPNKKDATRNFPGSGNLSDFQKQFLEELEEKWLLNI